MACMNYLFLLCRCADLKLLPTIMMALMILQLWACSSDSRELSFVPEDGVILAFGDSLTAGKGVAKTQSYPAVLASLSERQVINAGVSGETTSEGLHRLQKALDQSHPDLLILLEGGNDILRNQNLAITKNNLAKMIDIANAHGVETLLIGVPEKSLFSGSSASLYQELADEYRLVFEESLIKELLKTPAYKSDQVHFNQKGYRVMAERIYNLLLENEAL